MRFAAGLLFGAALAVSAGQSWALDPAGGESCHAGAYRLSDGREVVLTASGPTDLRYRFWNGDTGKLFRSTGDEAAYESGGGWDARTPTTLRVVLGPCAEGRLRWSPAGGPSLSGERTPLPTTPLRVRSGDAAIYAELVTPPAGRRPKAVVVLQFGSGKVSALRHNYLQHLLPLRDIAVVQFDKRGTGRSDGQFTAVIQTLAADLSAVAAAARARPELKGVPLGLMGESQGGWVAPLAAATARPDFVIVSHGLAVSMVEEDRLEVAQSLARAGYGADVLAKGEALHQAATRVAVSRLAEGLPELERLKSAYKDEPWLTSLAGDYTGPLSATPADRMGVLRAAFDYPYDLEYDPGPALDALAAPTLWVLAKEDSETPHETTLEILRGRQARGAPIDIAVFPDADHGMVEVVRAADGRAAKGGYAPGYFDLLADWILARRLAGPFGAAELEPRAPL